MSLQTGNALLLIAVFVLPGFVTLLMRERTYRVRDQDSPFERLLNALYFSSIVYTVIVLGWAVEGLDPADLSRLYSGEGGVRAYLLLGLLGLFVLPVLIAELGRRWQKSRKVRPWLLSRLGIDISHGVPAGWEQLFQESLAANAGPGLMLRVTLEDGRVVGGYFGCKSLAGYTARTRDLFLEEQWILNARNWFERPAKGSAGLWIAEDQILSIEAYGPASIISDEYNSFRCDSDAKRETTTTAQS
ncbi:MAG: DUF6338 family protein [Solirubrobacterales bacterium]